MLNPVEAVLSMATGAGLILLALFDAYATLFSHGRRYSLSGALTRAIWRVCHRLPQPGGLALAGPASFLSGVGTWVALLAVGWALVYWPWMPSGFLHPAKLEGGGSRLLDSLYFSLVTLATLGYGDISPRAAWLRLVVPLQAVLGFGIITASASWLLSIFPVLSRRRALAYEICLLEEVRRDPSDPGPPSPLPAGLYAELTARLVAVEGDVVMLPVAYYFHQDDARFALAAQMRHLLELAEQARGQDTHRDAHFQAGLLLRAIDDFAATLAEQVGLPGGGSTRDVLDAYARDHAVAEHTSGPR